MGTLSFGLNITGDRWESLAARLELIYANSPLAKELLDTCNAMTINLKDAIGKPKIAGNEVKIFWRHTTPTGVHFLGVSELGETALFELNNLLIQPQFDTTPKELQLMLRRGIETGMIESQSTVRIVAILRQLIDSVKYIPSKWGRRQMAMVGTLTGDDAARFVTNTAHDSTQTNEYLLPTKYLYAYQRLEGELKQQSSAWAGCRCFNKVVTIKRSGAGGGSLAGVLKAKKPNDKPKKVFLRYVNAHGTTNAGHQMFVWLIYAACSLSTASGWSVQWADTSTRSQDWKCFADALVRVQLSIPVKHDALKVVNLKLALMSAIDSHSV